MEASNNISNFGSNNKWNNSGVLGKQYLINQLKNSNPTSLIQGKDVPQSCFWGIACKHLKDRDIKSVLLGSTSFVCGDIVPHQDPIDLSEYSNLTEVEVGNVERDLILPASVKSFKCNTINRCSVSFADGQRVSFEKFCYGDIASGVVLDLGSNLEISAEVIVVGNVDGELILPPNVKGFECGNINSNGVVDLTNCQSLTMVDACDIRGQIRFQSLESEKKIKFKCCNIEAKLDLSTYGNLKEIFTENIKGELILPSFVEKFKCYDIEGGLDLSTYDNLKEISTGNLKGRLILPHSVEEFECGSIEGDGVLDCNYCKKLKIVEAVNIEGTVILPPNVKELNCGNISSRAIFQLENEKVDENTSFPSSIEKFVCRNIGSSTIVNLRYCDNLLDVYIGDMDGTIILPQREFELNILHLSSQGSIIWNNS